ncbi:MAG: hypothetical protein LC648_06575 [Novosphingobium sp.]|nr:hypothetical protein [Novosphingobium sp.]
MFKYLITAAAVAALGTATPAAAQVGGIVQQQGLFGLFGGGGINSRLDALDRTIRLSFERGELTEREARRLQNQLLELRQLNQTYRIDGLSRAERLELQQRLDRLERRIQQARFDQDDRFDDDDDDDRFGRNGCPPGLAKKNNGCLPPGQAKKMGDSDRFGWRDRDRFEDSDRFVYRRDGDRVLQIDRRTGQVVRVFRRR